MMQTPTLVTFSADREGNDMSKPSTRDRWRQVKGKWTRSLGNRGTRVRLFQKRRDGTFYRAVWLGGRRDLACLHTNDRDEAERLGRRLLGTLMLGVPIRQEPETITLGALWDRYQRDCANFLDNKPRTKKETEGRAKVLLAFFGSGLDVRTLTAKDQAAFVAARLAGGIRYDGDAVTAPVRPRSVEADLVLLHSMLGWAARLRVNGGRWLEFNPLEGVGRPREQNPRRPVATWERYDATRLAMQARREAAETSTVKALWAKMELALVLASSTGRRLGSIQHLQWDDFDFQNNRIHWRAEHDKKGRDSVIPYPAALLDEVRKLQRVVGALGGWVFAGERKPERPMDRHLFDKWLRIAEADAELPKLEGGLWHPYRRAWATARKHLSLKDVAAAGGWKDYDTLLKCYQHPDEETLLQVTSEERKVREVQSGR